MRKTITALLIAMASTGLAGEVATVEVPTNIEVPKAEIPKDEVHWLDVNKKSGESPYPVQVSVKRYRPSEDPSKLKVAAKFKVDGHEEYARLCDIVASIEIMSTESGTIQEERAFNYKRLLLAKRDLEFSLEPDIELLETDKFHSASLTMSCLRPSKDNLNPAELADLIRTTSPSPQSVCNPEYDERGCGNTCLAKLAPDGKKLVCFDNDVLWPHLKK